MKISELIEYLTQTLEEHGDIGVIVPVFTLSKSTYVNTLENRDKKEEEDKKEQ